ncbi:hypothetical protein LSG31_07655 [Fodinisporobacter ferrooxydans]|uniref:Uncharacterized protein n=1 Tax=Fodinisporobacter ferrooxydans TaxID=2901836 RepID=A0ABY4CNK9_9BACL|nr:hypothetical protein LSG31_07655 [Alicyclobacillaceae bacterium MYW30-H2]
MHVKRTKVLQISKNIQQIEFQDIFRTIDRKILEFLQNYSALIASIMGIGLCAWGLFRHDLNLVIETLLSGAIGYYIGFFPALIVNLFIFFLRIHSAGPAYQVFDVKVLQFFGCAYIAWLGFCHRQSALFSRQQFFQEEPHAHLISWTLVNEVRNSLMAMRLLLFKYYKSETEQSEFKLVEDELLRLELIFGSLSKSHPRQKPPKH